MTMNGDYKEKAVSVVWTPSQVTRSGSQAKYSATISSGETLDRDSDLNANFSGLTEGTEYTVSITTRKLRNPAHSQSDYVHFTSPGVRFYTSKHDVL